MFDIKKAEQILENTNKRIEEQKKLIKEYLETLASTTIGLQVDDKAVDVLVAMSVVNDNISFKDKVTAELGCTQRDYLLALRKFTLRLGLEKPTSQLKVAERALLVEEACKDNQENYNLLLEIIKSDIEKEQSD